MEQRKVYFGTDRMMLQHRCEWDDYHLEHPGRLSAVLEKLEEELEKVASTFEEVYFNNYSYEAAALSVGISLKAMETVLSEAGR
ncbi:unnamed protein product [Onchocerca flexuosa]|uniref:HEPN domain-containing protein n=1 Tax=Onchocerca flexuosa TaxID=387005 RepID=A0A183I5V4_9BILA|nr:unnamed protein product [Onchocerca flexuosa]